MKSVLPSQFWNEEVSSARSLDAVSHALPNEPPPLGLVAGTRLSRSQQMLLLQRLLWIPCIPLYVVDTDNKGGLVIDRVLGATGGDNWWATLTGRVRAQRMFGRGNQSQSRSSIAVGDSAGHNRRTIMIGETSASKALDKLTSNPFDRLKEHAGRFLDSSMYALCLRSRLRLGSRTTLSSTSELDTLSRQSDQQAVGAQTRVPWRGRVALRHKCDQHQVLLEGAYHECYIDRESRYWDVPQTVSLDMASGLAPGSLRYRLGVHHSAGAPTECGATEDIPRKVPLGALPGLRFQAAGTMEKSLSLWKADLSRSLKKSYSFLEARPHISLSGVLGGLLRARFDPLYGGHPPQSSIDPNRGLSGSDHSLPQDVDPRYSADLFASIGLNAQFGLFERRFGDFTKLGVRIDLGAATAIKSLSSSGYQISSSPGEAGDTSKDRGHPTLALSLQQQVVGPLRARFDSRVSIDPLNLKQQPHVQEIICGLDYPLDATGASKLTVWYSPTRREGMAEFRVLER